jgi:hypothetical protein
MEEPANAPTLDPSLQPLLLTPQEYSMIWGDSKSNHRKHNGLLATFVLVIFIVGIIITGYWLVGYLGSKARGGF